MKYYLIEKYAEYEDRPCGGKYTTFDVREFNDLAAVKNAMLKGAKHGGQLIAAQGLEFKIALTLEKPPQKKHKDQFVDW